MTHLSPRQRQRKAFLAKWSKVDWSKQDYQLGEETSLSRERIRQIRQQVGAPKSTHAGWLRKTAEALQWVKDNLDKFKGLSGVELERKYGLSPDWGGRLHQFLKPFLRDGRLNRKHPWDRMNFRLPNRDLERIWKLPPNSAGCYRWRKRRPPSPWCFKPGSGDIQCSGRGGAPRNIGRESERVCGRIGRPRNTVRGSERISRPWNIACVCGRSIAPRNIGRNSGRGIERRERAGWCHPMRAGQESAS